ncbi:MAG TPA: hypothetical protein VGO16_08820 [Pseudonocardiaceae bacterium]|nr:hypothetical protein [Pseudonocardiaceae bacterium]
MLFTANLDEGLMRSSGELHLPNYNAIWSREFSLLIEDFKDSRARSLDTSDAVIGESVGL